MTNQTIETLWENSTTKLLAALCVVSLGLAAIDPVAVTWYATGNGAATGGVAGGVGAVGAATTTGVAMAGASTAAVVATGGAALVVVGAAAA